MLVELQPGRGLIEQTGKLRLAVLDRVAAQIVARDHEQIERAQERGRLHPAPTPQKLEHRPAVRPGDHHLAVDQEACWP